MIDTPDALMREVQDAVRHDQMMAMWRQYRKPLFAAAIALIVATAGAGMWRNYKEAEAGKTMQQMQKAMALYAQQSYDAAAKTYGDIANTALDKDARDLAQLWQARTLQKAGKDDVAAKVLEQLANRPQGQDLLWRDLGCIRLMGLSTQNTSCLDAGNSPLAPQRKLIKASLLWKEGKAKEAAALLQPLTQDTNAPASVRDQATQLLTVVENHEAD